MPKVQADALPEHAFLRACREAGGYVDCYSTPLSQAASQSEYVEAFYTTPLFKLERLLLAWLVARPSTDVQAGLLAAGALTAFAAWEVERQDHSQLLLRDFRGRTRSWLMAVDSSAGGSPSTRLYFGSAVVPVIDGSTGRPTLGFAYKALLGFHKLYSRALLGAAARRLARHHA